MKPELWQRVSDVMEKVLGLSNEERAVYLARLKDTDREIFTEVQALLSGEGERTDGAFGRLPSDLLDQVARETTDPESPKQPRDTRAPSPWPKKIGSYVIDGLVAKGGMGAVLRGYDADFDRTLAIKITLDKGAGNQQVERRFLKEAQITGKLQHPGIPPVHELGKLEDGRPYFAMKLIKGQTLRDLLANRENPNDGLKGHLDVFEQICQTVAYAHTRSIIHRDLKPLNVMVGAFGEVQVMDWGLAKELGVAPLDSDDEPMLVDFSVSPNVSTDDPEQTAAHTPEFSFADHSTPLGTREGAVFGTPAYMPAEQAEGKIVEVDAQSDVFGLGAILCEILIGRPPYKGETVHEVLEKACTGDTKEAFDLLDASGHDKELIDLTKRCLSKDKADRPANGSEVADAMAAYSARIQERLRQAELQRAEAEVRAIEEQKRAKIQRQRSRVTIGLVVTLLVLMVGGVAVYSWYKSVEMNARTVVTTNLDRSEQTLTQIRQATKPERGVFKLLLKRDQWEANLTQAKKDLERAEAALAGVSAPDLEKQLWEAKEELEKAQQDMRTAFALDNIRNRRAIDATKQQAYEKASKAYQAEFEKRGISLDDPKAAIDKIKASPIREQWVASLDDWALVTLYLQDRRKAKTLRKQLLQIAAEADHNQTKWFRQLRQEKTWLDHKKLNKLVSEAPVKNLSSQTITLLSDLLQRNGQNASALAFLKKAAMQNVRDFWINYRLGMALQVTHPRSALEHLRIANARRESQLTREAMLVSFALAGVESPDLADQQNLLLGIAQMLNTPEGQNMLQASNDASDDRFRRLRWNEIPELLTRAQTTLAKNPDDVSALALKANAYKHLGKFDLAAKDYAKAAVRAGPANSLQKKLLVGQMECRDYGKELAELEKKEKNKGQLTAEEWKKLGWFALNFQHRYRKARNCFQRAHRMARSKDVQDDAAELLAIASLRVASGFGRDVDNITPKEAKELRTEALKLLVPRLPFHEQKLRKKSAWRSLSLSTLRRWREEKALQDICVGPKRHLLSAKERQEAHDFWLALNKTIQTAPKNLQKEDLARMMGLLKEFLDSGGKDLPAFDDGFGPNRPELKFQRGTKEAIARGQLTMAVRSQSYVVKLKQGRAYLITLESEAFNPLLLVSEGTKRKAKTVLDEDSGPGRNSAIIIMPEVTKTYVLQADAEEKNGTGEYTLRVQDLREVHRLTDKLPLSDVKPITTFRGVLRANDPLDPYSKGKRHPHKTHEITFPKDGDYVFEIRSEFVPEFRVEDSEGKVLTRWVTKYRKRNLPLVRNLKARKYRIVLTTTRRTSIGKYSVKVYPAVPAGKPLEIRGRLSRAVRGRQGEVQPQLHFVRFRQGEPISFELHSEAFWPQIEVWDTTKHRILAASRAPKGGSVGHLTLSQSAYGLVAERVYGFNPSSVTVGASGEYTLRIQRFLPIPVSKTVNEDSTE